MDTLNPTRPDQTKRLAFDPSADVTAVVIGRNEGERLKACLASLSGAVRAVVYVDSGSTDGSVAAAEAAGAIVVRLDMSRPFTAARARNAGVAALGADCRGHVQFLDGDCMVEPSWIPAAVRFLADNPDVGVVCGRRRERFPEASVYNRLCDREWDTPIGEAKACGGDALMRLDAFRAVGGYRDDLIAGEEPELCVRLRQAGWRVFRLDAEMTLHDAALFRFASWWKRTRRSGHAYAEGSFLHGGAPERHWVTETRRAIVWGFLLPAGILAAVAVTPAALALAAVYPLQVVRLALRDGGDRPAFEYALFTTIGKVAEFVGIADFHLRRLAGRRSGLIEYK